MHLTAALLILLLAAPAHAAIGADCNWAEPGRNPYTGPRQAAIMSFDHLRYTDRVMLALAVQWQPPTDVVAIGRSGIHGAPGYSYDASLNDMHFGRGQRCGTVTRDGWAPTHTETARAWCRGRWCIVIPDVCGNVAWAVRDLTPAGVMREAGAVRSVPEPSALWLVLIAVLALLLVRYGRGKR